MQIPSTQNQSFTVTRRNVLQLAGGLGVSFFLPAWGDAATKKRGEERPKSLITLWMKGGPSQLETWDPHPNTKIGSKTKSIKTKVSGLEIAAIYPEMAEQIHHLNVIRSMVSKEGDHERGTAFLKTGYRPDPTTIYPSLGAIAVKELPNPQIEIPQHVSLGNGQWAARGGYLGDKYDAFKIYNPGKNVRNMKPRVNHQRQERRLKNLEVISKSFRRGRVKQVDETLHQLTIEKSLIMMSSDQLKAFDISKEPSDVVKAYGDSKFGRGCLVARRLVEMGVRAIEVTLTGFDTHVNNYNGHVTQAKILDPAFATLIKELKERDLLESTVLICIGEFGRTPAINAAEGRDHFPSGFSCVLGGGGLKSGLVIGKTDPQGEKLKPTTPIKVKDLSATVLNALGLPYEKELISPIGRPLKLSDGTPIPQLLADNGY